MEPLSSSAATSVTLSGDKILRPFVEEGERPSLEQIDRWIKEQVIVNMVIRKKEMGNETVTSLSGRISENGSYRSEEKADALIWIEGFQFGVYVREITSYRVDAIKKVVRPLLLPSLSKEDSQVPTVTLLSHGERFVVDQERLKEAIPFFKAMLESGMRESKLAEIDTSSFFSITQLNQVIKYTEGLICISESNAMDLLYISDFLGMIDLCKDIQSFLIQKLPQRTSIKDLDVIDAFVLSDSHGMTELHKVIKSFLLQNITRGDIEILKSNTVDSVLQNFLENIRHEIIHFYLNNDAFFGVGRALSLLLNENGTLKDTTTISIECKIMIEYRFSYLSDEGLKDILRILEILGANIETLNIFNIYRSNFFEIVEYVKCNSQIKSLNVSFLPKWIDNFTGEEEIRLDDCIHYLSTRLKTFSMS